MPFRDRTAGPRTMRALSPFLFCLSALGAPASAATDGGHCFLTPWTPGPELADANLGTAIAIEDTTAVLGSWTADEVYVYERQGTQWTLVQTLPSPSNASDAFGSSVALDGDLLAVGDRYDDTGGVDAGAVFLYERSGSSWSLQHSFYGETNEAFGTSVDVHDGAQTRLAVGAPGLWSLSGAVHVLLEQPGGWFLVDELGPAGNGEFGFSLDMDQSTLVVGDHTDDAVVANGGSVYVYQVHATGTNLLQKLAPPGLQSTDFFGRSVSVVHNTALAVGAHRDNEAGFVFGAAYVYDYEALPIPPFGHFADPEKILPEDGVTFGSFGESVDLDHDGYRVVIGARGEGTNASGAAHVYRPSVFGPAFGYDLLDTLELEAPIGNELFGATVAMYEDQVLVGCPWSNLHAVRGGAGYLFSLQPKTQGLGQCPCDTLAHAESFGTGKPGSVGIPVLSISRPPVPGETSLLKLSNALPGVQPVIFWGNVQATIPFDGGEFYMADPNGELLPIVGPLGQVGAPWNLPNQPVLCGSEVIFQVLFLDPGAAGSFRTAQTNGLRTIVGY